jgi:hypothetical protein
MWKYVYFLVYLQEKNEKDCDGMESRLKAMVHNEDSGWIPIVKEEDLVEEALVKERAEQKKIVKSTVVELFKGFKGKMKAKFEVPSD